MKCPKCEKDTRVTETRESNNKVRRRRRCQNSLCGHIFSTYETLKEDGIVEELRLLKAKHTRIRAAFVELMNI